MTTAQEILFFDTDGRGTSEITEEVSGIVDQAGIETGLCHVFSRHTSAGVIVTENADPTVRADLERLLTHVAPDGWREFRHRAEGDDDMSAHARTLLAGDSVLIPVSAGKLALGTWQGIFLWEHRTDANRRGLVVTVLGE